MLHLDHIETAGAWTHTPSTAGRPGLGEHHIVIEYASRRDIEIIARVSTAS